jgi:hypothetical protein
MANQVSPKPHLTVLETSENKPLSNIVRTAFEDAFAGRGEMDSRVYDVDGFCGRKHRLFFNNLVRSVENPRYLEIGIFRGATMCAAIAGNKVKCCGIDNWTEYGGKSSEFYVNLANIKGSQSTVSILEQDFRTVDYSHIGKFNLFFYDGPHQEQDQFDGVKMALPALDKQAVLLVDDWNWIRVRRATMNALRAANARLDFAIEVRTSLDDNLPEVAYRQSDWHNGVFAGVISQ